MFGGVFNRPLRWCIWCNLDGVFLIKFSTFSILLFYLHIGNCSLLFYSIFIFLFSLLFVFLSFLIDLVVYSFYTFRLIVSPWKICKNRNITESLCVIVELYLLIYIYIYIFIHIYIPGWLKNTQVAWPHLSVNKSSEKLR